MVLFVLLIFTQPQPVLAQDTGSTPDPNLPVYTGVETAAPNPDGSITHRVKYGDTLVVIAQAYGITLEELYSHNPGINPQRPSYREGDVLIIRPAFTPTPYMTETNTPAPPTRTPFPTRTPRPTYTATVFHTLAPTRTDTPTPAFKIPTIDDLGSSRPLIAYAFIIISAIGLVAVVATSFLPYKK